MENLDNWIWNYLEANVDQSRWLYHCVGHTRDVVRDADALAAAAGLGSGERRLLHVAALFHDTGYAVCPERHEAESAALAGRVLPEFGFGATEIAIVRRLIEATRMPTAPADELEMLICDADLGTLGSADFLRIVPLLRRELELGGKVFSETEWWRFEVNFLTRHRYYSEAARALFGAGLEENRRMALRHLEEEVGK